MALRPLRFLLMRANLTIEGRGRKGRKECSVFLSGLRGLCVLRRLVTRIRT